jgi:hypothetical protein
VLESFYEVAAQASFTLLGLWWLVMQSRRSSWSPDHRRAASAISLQFAVPGMMSLVSLVDADSSVLWRLSFGITAVAGALALILLHGGMPAAFRNAGAARASYIVAFVLYASIALVALLADVIREAGAHPQQLDAILLALLFFVGLWIAWLLFDE